MQSGQPRFHFVFVFAFVARVDSAGDCKIQLIDLEYIFIFTFCKGGHLLIRFKKFDQAS